MLSILLKEKTNYSLNAKIKNFSGSILLNSRSSASTSTPVRRSTRIKRDEPKDEQLSNNVQELSSENEENSQQQIEEKKIDESPENAVKNRSQIHACFKKQLKTLFNFHIYNNFSDDQKKSSLETITEL
ncbi:hypothetical protein GLOIN_2v1520280 [Rhizophagus clarus]|uniref:Uncharacterized protein n=1 Tax=Rhizophagus clarus TaxID=94130 RepID=A0A8H3MAM0_9GLOM|nr:hypothetical protein GLOIN_2v1520280 [Rhizophagus clarus]